MISTTEPETRLGERQELNDRLATQAKAGDHAALAQLWELNKPLLHIVFQRWRVQFPQIADAAGLTMEDLEQEGFFAIQYAAEHYSGERGAFGTYLGYAVKRQIQEAVRGEHTRTIVSKEGKRYSINANPLNASTSLNAPVLGSDGEPGETERGNLLPDPTAQQPFDEVEQGIYLEQLHEAMQQALAGLTAQEAEAVCRRFYARQTLDKVSDALGVTRDQARVLQDRAIRRLRRSPALAKWREEFTQSSAWQGTGFAAWGHMGSVEERTIERLDTLCSD